MKSPGELCSRIVQFYESAAAFVNAEPTFESSCCVAMIKVKNSKNCDHPREKSKHFPILIKNSFSKGFPASLFKVNFRLQLLKLNFAKNTTRFIVKCRCRGRLRSINVIIIVMQLKKHLRFAKPYHR